MDADDQLEDAIRILVAWAASEPLIQRVFIYGSRVRGRSMTGGPIRPDSDLDIAVEPDAPADERLGTYIVEAAGWESTLAKLLPWCPHLDFYGAEAAVVCKAVAEAGGLIYTKTAG